MAGPNSEKNIANYKFAEVPTHTPFYFPTVPSHNPDPTYRAKLIEVLNQSQEEGQRIQKCLAEPKQVQLQKLRQYLQLNKEAKDLLMKDGFTGFAGGRRKQRKTRRKRRTQRRRKN
jgi:hypothetical protein